MNLDAVKEAIGIAENRPVRVGWTRIKDAHNDFLSYEKQGFAISYNPNDFLREFNRLSGREESKMDSSQPETALILYPAWWRKALFTVALLLPFTNPSLKKIHDKLEMRNKYLILRGDHCEQYERLAKQGKEACIKYFEENQDLRHFFSD